MPANDTYARTTMVDRIIHILYKDQLAYWNVELQKLISTNAMNHGRRKGPFGIVYLGKTWNTDVHKRLLPEAFSYLEVHPDFPELEKQLIPVLAELSELQIEQYEVRRFLSSLLIFPAPVKVFEDVLGSLLFKEIEGEFDIIHMTVDSRHWDANSQVALMTYVEQHRYVIKTMTERLLMNLLTRDQTLK